MFTKPFFTAILLLFTISSFAQTKNKDFLAYIDKFKDLAMDEMERAGIPASIKLAQGLLESNAGRSDLARRANNHFGIKCGGSWEGKTFFKEDDDVDEKGRLIKSCFRSYKNVRASYVAHSEFLRDPKKDHRYGFLFQLNPQDYKRWAIGLKRAGYATSATYHTKLIRLIETYELSQYDKARLPGDIASRPNRDRPSTSSPGDLDIFKTNDVRFTLAESGEMLDDLARRSDVPLRSILKYNENRYSVVTPLQGGTKIYLQPKRASYRGRKTWHTVENETMFEISQLYGISLDKLLKRNKMTKGMEVAKDARVKIRGGKVSARPKLGTDRDIDSEIPDFEVEEEEVVDNKPPKRERRNDRRDRRNGPVLDNERPTGGDLETEEDESFEEELDFEIVEEEEEEFVPPLPDEPIVSTPTRQPRPRPTPEPDTADEEEELPEIEGPVVRRPNRNDEVRDTNDEVRDTNEERPADQPEVVESPDAVFYTVERGDTLWAISRKFNTSVDAIKKLNKFESDFLRRGWKIRVR